MFGINFVAANGEPALVVICCDCASTRPRVRPRVLQARHGFTETGIVYDWTGPCSTARKGSGVSPRSRCRATRGNERASLRAASFGSDDDREASMSDDLRYEGARTSEQVAMVPGAHAL